MLMTDRQRAVLAHVVIDPEEWLGNAVSAFGEDGAAQALTEKVARWEAEYDDTRMRLGAKYKTRAERDEEQA